MADYVVSTWDEFLQHNTSGDTVKFANPHEVNGEIVLSGTGTQADPYIVSTYEEMLFATGATYIWKVKLIDREQKIYRYRYISDYDEQRNPIYSEIFCKYDDSLSTIDFNDIQPEGFSATLTFLANSIDFNGWTFLNLIIKNQIKFNNEVTNAYINGRFINVIIDGPNSAVIFLGNPSYVKWCIFDITVKNIQNEYAIFVTLPSCSTITIHAKDGVVCKLSQSDGYYVQNTMIILDVSCFWRFGGIALDTCVVSGGCETSYTSNIPLATYSRNTIFNIDTTTAWEKAQVLSGITFLNSTKAPNVKGEHQYFKRVPDEVMRDPQALADLGLPIGVD